MPPIISMDEYEETKNILVFGDSGIGKTVWASMAPKTLILGVEQGLVSARRQGSKADLWKIESWAGTETDSKPENNLRAAYRWLAKGGYRRYSWIDIDGITELQEMAKMHLLREAFEIDPTGSEFVLEWQSNLELQQMTKIMVKNFCKLPVNTVFTALPMDMDDAEGNNRVMPFVDGKKGAISQYVCGQMGAVGSMRQFVKKVGTKREYHRRIYWEYRKPYFGKNRFGLPPYTEDVSLPDLIPMMKDQPESAVRRTRTRTTRTPARRVRATGGK